MDVTEFYARQSRFKKPLLLLCMVFLLAFAALWAYLAATFSFSIVDHIIFASIYFHLAGWIPIWFEVDMTQEEMEALSDEFAKQIAKQRNAS